MSWKIFSPGALNTHTHKSIKKKKTHVKLKKKKPLWIHRGCSARPKDAAKTKTMRLITREVNDKGIRCRLRIIMVTDKKKRPIKRALELFFQPWPSIAQSVEFATNVHINPSSKRDVDVSEVTKQSSATENEYVCCEMRIELSI